MKKTAASLGFTLMETIVVLAIIAVLLAAASPNIAAYMRQGSQVRESAAAETVYNALQTYAANKSISLLQGGVKDKLLPPAGTPGEPEVYAYISNVTDAISVEIVGTGEPFVQPTSDNHAVIQVTGSGIGTVITVRYGKSGSFVATFN